MFPDVATMGNMKTRSIQIIPAPETDAKIDTLAKLLRTSRAGFCNLALDFFTPLLESGKARVVNGRVEIVGEIGKTLKPAA